jgi:uncharacterized repeat protein (TIGR03803 family)
MHRKGFSIAAPMAAVIFTVVLLSLAATAQTGTEKILHSFGKGADGLYPFARLIFDATATNLYGTTYEGGTGPCNGGCGSVFELAPESNGKWKETVLYNFQGRPNDAGKPAASLVFDGAGNLYGTTRFGGSTNCQYACGAVFELSPNSNGTWTETLLHLFTGADGANPNAELIWDNSGNLYSTTSAGGAHGQGTVFELSPSGSTWTLTTLYNFGGRDGNGPLGGLIFDSSGNLYGTTSLGGRKGHGTVFELTPSNGTWKESVLYSFAGSPSDGSYPSAGVIVDSAGNIYGTARDGGSRNCSIGCGTVFELSPSSKGAWKESFVYLFTGEPDGAAPFSSLIFDASGNLWGTTQSGGVKNVGVIYELVPSNGTWTESVLHSFEGWPKDGARSYANLLLNPQGSFYGTTIFGGKYDPGTVFEFVP